MKKYFLYFISLFFATNSSAQLLHESGMHIEHSSFAEALSKAKSENKLLFVDCYTTWCGPCKWMANNVFTHDTVGRFFNHYFVNLKSEMEHGEGPGLAQKFQIYAYPTFVFLKSDGSIINKGMGAMPPSKFIELGISMLGADANLDSVVARFNKGNHSQKNLISIMLLSQLKKMDYEKYLLDYFKAQPESAFTNYENFEVMQNYSFNILSPEIQFLIKNKADFEKLHGAENVKALLKRIVEANLNASEKKKVSAAKNLLKSLN